MPGEPDLIRWARKRARAVPGERDLKLMHEKFSTGAFEDGQGTWMSSKSWEQPWLTASKDMETSILMPQGTKVSHNHVNLKEDSELQMECSPTPWF